MKKKLVKSNKDRVVSGVLAGIGEYLNIDPTIIRVLFALTIFFSFWATIIIYILLAIVIPTESGQSRQSASFEGEFSEFEKTTKQGKRPRKEAEKVEDEWSDF
ncbi:PspC domain-containing protein [Vagococcus coleopterorum]|uniref:PspC domain-containing protein n=1 Tax=Vagococcus coleopterorum TaxID=2714946 RepID=A0A6G8AN94_9ENTE|nr:PspC domain-containing protein [Vagococcus coleopterorum]QIL46551.1 PspC domain-containing protein [Vagococcus coleopterorum]